MEKAIPFNEIMENHKNWHKDVDFDGMSDNYKVLKPIMNKFFFTKYPENPALFSLIFSSPEFAQNFIRALITFNITNLNKVWFEEFSSGDRDKLFENGMY